MLERQQPELNSQPMPAQRAALKKRHPQLSWQLPAGQHLPLKMQQLQVSWLAALQRNPPHGSRARRSSAQRPPRFPARAKRRQTPRRHHLTTAPRSPVMAHSNSSSRSPCRLAPEQLHSRDRWPLSNASTPPHRCGAPNRRSRAPRPPRPRAKARRNRDREARASARSRRSESRSSPRAPGRHAGSAPQPSAAA
jgi:hypothetical protein